MNKRKLGYIIFSLAVLGYIVMMFGVKSLILLLSTITFHCAGMYFISESKKEE